MHSLVSAPKYYPSKLSSIGFVIYCYCHRKLIMWQMKGEEQLRWMLGHTLPKEMLF